MDAGRSAQIILLIKGVRRSSEQDRKRGLGILGKTDAAGAGQDAVSLCVFFRGSADWDFHRRAKE